MLEHIARRFFAQTAIKALVRMEKNSDFQQAAEDMADNFESEHESLINDTLEQKDLLVSLAIQALTNARGNTTGTAHALNS